MRLRDALMLPCPQCLGDPRVCAYCDRDLHAQGARIVVHADHVCLVIGTDPPPRERLRLLFGAAKHRTHAERLYAADRERAS